MRALMYLTRRSLVNNLKKAVQKPSTLIALIFAIGYGIFIVVSLGGLADPLLFFHIPHLLRGNLLLHQHRSRRMPAVIL